jgi:hypothetical protein
MPLFRQAIKHYTRCSTETDPRLLCNFIWCITELYLSYETFLLDFTACLTEKTTGNRGNGGVNPSDTSRVLCKAKESVRIFHCLETRRRNHRSMSVARRWQLALSFAFRKCFLRGPKMGEITEPQTANQTWLGGLDLSRYSTVLASSDFPFAGLLKKHLSDQRFGRDSSVKQFVTFWLQKPDTFFPSNLGKKTWCYGGKNVCMSLVTVEVWYVPCAMYTSMSEYISRHQTVYLTYWTPLCLPYLISLQGQLIWTYIWKRAATHFSIWYQAIH